MMTLAAAQLARVKLRRFKEALQGGASRRRVVSRRRFKEVL